MHLSSSSSSSSSYIFHGVGPLVDPFRSHVSRSLFKGSIRPASSRETCQWLKFPVNGLRTQNRVSPAVGLLPLASEPACLGMAFPPFLAKQLYRYDSVVISSFVRTGYSTRRWGWLLGRVGYSVTHHYPLYICWLSIIEIYKVHCINCMKCMSSLLCDFVCR